MGINGLVDERKMTENANRPATGAKYFWRAAGYFVALAVINLLAHGELGYILSQTLPSWLATASRKVRASLRPATSSSKRDRAGSGSRTAPLLRSRR